MRVKIWLGEKEGERVWQDRTGVKKRDERVTPLRVRGVASTRVASVRGARAPTSNVAVQSVLQKPSRSVSLSC